MMWQSVGNSDKSHSNRPCRDFHAHVAIAKRCFVDVCCFVNKMAAMMPKHLMK